VLFAKYNYCDQVEKDEMGVAYSTNGRGEENSYIVGGKDEGKR
jgi:hypothetical protein